MDLILLSTFFYARERVERVVVFVKRTLIGNERRGVLVMAKWKQPTKEKKIRQARG
jgi:predicted nicotinamide N-methyase